MTTTFIASGPTSSLGGTLRVALAGAGLTDVVESVGHGLPPGTETRWTGDRYPNGDIVPGTGVVAAVEPSFPTSFLQGDGPDEAIDRVVDVLEPFGWQLRSSGKRLGDAERRDG